MEKEIQTSTQIKEEEVEYDDEPGIDPEEAEFIANSLFIDTSPKNQRDEIKTESFENGSISDCSSQSDDAFSKRMKLKSQFGSGFDKSAITNSDNIFGANTDNEPVLTDFSYPVKSPAGNEILYDEETDDGSLSIDDDTSDEDYVPEEDMSGSSNDEILYSEPSPKRKVVRRTQRKQKLSTKFVSESSTKVIVTSTSTNVISIITSNASQIMNLSGKYDFKFWVALSSKYFFITCYI